MNMAQIMKMMNGGRENPALDQLIAVSNMLGKLPKEEQSRIITNFANELQEAVNRVEGKDVKTEE